MAYGFNDDKSKHDLNYELAEIESKFKNDFNILKENVDEKTDTLIQNLNKLKITYNTVFKKVSDLKFSTGSVNNEYTVTFELPNDCYTVGFVQIQNSFFLGNILRSFQLSQSGNTVTCTIRLILYNWGSVQTITGNLFITIGYIKIQ